METVTRTASGEGEGGWARRVGANTATGREMAMSERQTNMRQFTRGKKGGNAD
jgi:hypothetical protein